MDIKNDIVNEKNTLNENVIEQNMEQFVSGMNKGNNKNDAALEQYLQNAMVKIKNLEGQNRDLKEELGRAKDVMNKTSTKGFKR